MQLNHREVREESVVREGDVFDLRLALTPSPSPSGRVEMETNETGDSQNSQVLQILY
jgi:hypothetical protein